MDSYYPSRAMHYYHTKTQETNDPYYWFNLTDVQVRAGLINEALQTINNALSFPIPYPSKQGLLEMRSKLQPLSSREINLNKPSIVTINHGDIDGDGIIENVLLTINKTPNSPFGKDINLVVQSGRTNQSEQILFKDNSGYTPTLFLGDFTGNKVDDILVVIDTGGSGGTILVYVFSYMNGQIRQIFNSNAFNEDYKYAVTYQDQYKTTVISHKPKEKCIIDLTYKSKKYLTDIYNKNGILKSPIEGWVNSLAGLYPVDFNRDRTYELEGYQRIAERRCWLSRVCADRIKMERTDI